MISNGIVRAGHLVTRHQGTLWGGILERAACQTHHPDGTCTETDWRAPKPHSVTEPRTHVMSMLESALRLMIAYAWASHLPA
jgi:hypothetical protein